MSFSSITRQTARKPHQCAECRCSIAPGQRYERQAGTFDGDFYDNSFCLECADLWGAAWDHFDWCDPSETCMMGDLRSELAEDGITDLPAFLAKQRERWRQQKIAEQNRYAAPWRAEDLALQCEPAPTPDEGSGMNTEGEGR